MRAGCASVTRAGSLLTSFVASSRSHHNSSASRALATTPAAGSSSKLLAAARGAARTRASSMAASGGGSSGGSSGWQAQGWDPLAQESAKAVSPSAERNKQPILEELAKHLPDSGLVVEVASGTGQHVSHFAAALSPQLRWQPTDVTPELFASIRAYTAALPNVLPPQLLDAAAPADAWPVSAPLAAVFASNVTHISHWPVTLGLIAGAGKLLRPGGVLCIYGPFTVDGRFTTDSNRQFHETLLAQDPQWGYRDVADIAAAAAAAGLRQAHVVDMPANNHMLVFRNA